MSTIINNNLISDNLVVIKNITSSFCKWGLDNTFILIQYNDIPYLIYATKSKSIISYNLKEENINTEIKNAHKSVVTSFRYYYQNINKRHIIMSIAGEKNNIKLWDFSNWSCIINILNIYEFGLLFSSCFLNENNIDDSILTSSSSSENGIKIYDFSGNFIKLINGSNDKTLFIDSFYDEINSKLYIITGNDGYAKSYDYMENKLYHKYIEDGDSWHCSIKINKSQNILKLIDSCWKDDFLRIWDFHSGILLSKIKTYGKNIKSIFLYNEDYLFIGCYDHSIRLIDIKNEKYVTSYIGHKYWVCTINKVLLPTYGECLISQGLGSDEMIKIWVNID